MDDMAPTKKFNKEIHLFSERQDKKGFIEVESLLCESSNILFVSLSLFCL
jgi:hypothetical protein